MTFGEPCAVLVLSKMSVSVYNDLPDWWQDARNIMACYRRIAAVPGEA